MPWTDTRTRNVTRAEYDDRARQARLAFERLERALFPPITPTRNVRWTARLLALALRRKARSGVRPCRVGDDIMAGENDISPTLSRRGRAEIVRWRAGRTQLEPRRHRTHAHVRDLHHRRAAHPCGLAGMRVVGASSRTQKAPSTASAR
jgi:hypothetical protein